MGTRKLDSLPNDTILEIARRSGFSSCLALRKVCKKFRGVIDEYPPDVTSKSIIVAVDPNQVMLKINQFNEEEKEILHFYKRTETGCKMLTERFGKGEADFEITGTPDEANFGETFLQDLRLTLRHQKSLMNEFTIEWKDTEDNSLLDRFENVWKTHEQLIKVKEMYFFVTRAAEVNSVLPFLDPKKLKQISISQSKEDYRDRIDLDTADLEKWSDLDQWKGAETIFLELPLPDSSCLKKFFSVGRVMVQVWFNVMHLKDCLLVKEAFISSQILKDVFITFRSFPESEKKKFTDILGPPAFEGRHWFFKLPDPSDILHVKLCSDELRFIRIDQSNLTDIGFVKVGNMF